jgi:NAD(P)-dependent dehydrogenase (short-subunit alcohol dehydrogenase family)
MFDFTGKRVLVTGGARSIDAATAALALDGGGTAAF